MDGGGEGRGEAREGGEGKRLADGGRSSELGEGGGEEDVRQH
jgi:hypothetical protein